MKELTLEFAEILGLLCAEGSHILAYSTYYENKNGKKRLRKNKKSERIEFYNKNLKLLLHYQGLLQKSFSYTPKITKHGKINICTSSIIKDIIQHTELGCDKWQVPKMLKKSNIKTKISFLRGYFDGDGTTSNIIRLFSVNKESLLNVLNLIKELGFKATFQGPILKKDRRPSYIIKLSRKERERFLNVIKPISKI